MFEGKPVDLERTVGSLGPNPTLSYTFQLAGGVQTKPGKCEQNQEEEYIEQPYFAKMPNKKSRKSKKIFSSHQELSRFDPEASLQSLKLSSFTDNNPYQQSTLSKHGVLSLNYPVHANKVLEDSESEEKAGTKTKAYQLIITQTTA